MTNKLKFPDENESLRSKQYTRSDKARAFCRGFFGWGPLIEVAREGVKRDISPELRDKYVTRIVKTAYSDYLVDMVTDRRFMELENPNYADVGGAMSPKLQRKIVSRFREISRSGPASPIPSLPAFAVFAVTAVCSAGILAMPVKSTVEVVAAVAVPIIVVVASVIQTLRGWARLRRNADAMLKSGEIRDEAAKRALSECVALSESGTAASYVKARIVKRSPEIKLVE
ncbi:MAG: hypothetical protein PHV13_06250 [Candidatus ainarchaeum sp.]|nr:hypothetical protein [Candidatus ainarchaeum sp.]